MIDLAYCFCNARSSYRSSTAIEILHFSPFYSVTYLYLETRNVLYSNLFLLLSAIRNQILFDC